MSRFDELVWTRTTLSGADLVHVRRLTRTWRSIADLSFSDMLLLVPIAGEDAHRFVVCAQVRSTTGQTIYPSDMVGSVVDEVERPILRKTWNEGTPNEARGRALGNEEKAEIQCLPVRHGDHLVALVTREESGEPFRRWGEMERAYREAFDRFASMLGEGSFPYAQDEEEMEAAPRVSDGVLVIDSELRMSYASPNAVSSLHRMGIHAYTTGTRMRDVGLHDDSVRAAMETNLSVTEEVERSDVSILMRIMPLQAKREPAGAVLLLRDVTDLRRRDRMLSSKDATIREIHHRVKNNLQTIAALLRLHGRRLDSEEARLALAESERRIRSIAIVHETLSRDTGDVVELGEVVRPLVSAVQDSVLAPDAGITFSIEGDAGEVPGEVATPLSVVLNELMQNAVDHAFGSIEADDGAEVRVKLARVDDEVTVAVIDNGVGLPDGFTLEERKGLGLSIVDALVTSELGGSIDLTSSDGTVVTVKVPLRTERPLS